MLGCAIGNFLGNEGFAIPAWIVIAGTCAYIFFRILKNEGVADDHDPEGKE